MLCLTIKECSEWLLQRGITEAPYARKLSRKQVYLQFAPPRQLDRVALITSLFEAPGEFSGALLHLTDWLWDPVYEGDPTAALRASAGETRALIDAPGFV